MKMNELSKSFVDYIFNRDNIDLHKKQDILKGAIKDSMGQGNPKGRRVKPNEELTKAIEEHLDTMLEKAMDVTDQKSYDIIFNETIDKMSKDASEKDFDCAFSFGRFQKIINMWIKYHVALSYYGDEDPHFAKYKKLLPFAHIPVDHFVIDWFSEKKNVPSEKTRDEVKKIGSWKWNLTKDSYHIIQQEAKEACKRNKIEYPLELEMEKMWTRDREGK